MASNITELVLSATENFTKIVSDFKGSVRPFRKRSTAVLLIYNYKRCFI